MKKLIFFISFIFLLTSCAVLNPSAQTHMDGESKVFDKLTENKPNQPELNYETPHPEATSTANEVRENQTVNFTVTEGLNIQTQIKG